MNLKFLQIIKDCQEELDHLPLIDIGTCGLHTVHGSFKTGLVASGWLIEKILKWMWYFLKDSPARREVYESITQTKTYPLPYCQTRWCENEPVAKTAAEFWLVYCKFIQYLASLPKSKQSQNNKSFDGLLLAVSDPLNVPSSNLLNQFCGSSIHSSEVFRLTNQCCLFYFPPWKIY